MSENALQPAFQIDPFKDANVILPEMKQNLAIFINRSSHVDAQQALQIIKAFKINKDKKKRLGDVHIHLKILDCSLNLEDSNQKKGQNTQSLPQASLFTNDY